MSNSIKVSTPLGKLIVGDEINIHIPKIRAEVYASSNGYENQTISTGGDLTGYPVGFEKSHSGHIFLLYVVGLGSNSYITFKGERGLQGAANILNSFCTKAFKQRGMSARALSRKDLKIKYETYPYGLSENSDLLKRIERSESVIYNEQLVEPRYRINGSYWLASTSGKIHDKGLMRGVDSIENGVLKSRILIDEEEKFKEEGNEILALVKIRVNWVDNDCLNLKGGL